MKFFNEQQAATLPLWTKATKFTTYLHYLPIVADVAPVAVTDSNYVQGVKNNAFITPDEGVRGKYL